MVKDLHNNLISIDGIIEDISEQHRTEKDKENLIFDLQTSVHTLSQRITGYIKELYSVSINSTISEAIRIMSANDSNAILVVGKDGEEIGFLTDRDLRERVNASYLSLDLPVYKIMSSPIYTISSTSTIYEALVKFRKKQIRRLVVKYPDNSIAGLLSIDEIFDASYTNFLFFIQNIENAVHINKIAEYRDQLLILVKSLIDYDTNIHSITNFITLIADTITRRIIELAINESGAPPVKFAFITMGSEGREEQTLATDQDNAIIYEDVSPGDEPEIRKYFNSLGDKICDNLAAAGYNYCKGGIMAKNNKWCSPYSVWKSYFTNWVTSSGPQELLDIKIFFDFRNVYGDEKLTRQLQNHINHITASFNTFFIFMNESVNSINIPDNMQKFKVPLDLKLLLLPVVDFARLHSIKNRLNETNTFGRLEAITGKGVLSNASFKSLSFYYNHLMRLRLKHQTGCLDSNIEVDNLISPSHLTEIDQQILKSYFNFIEDLKSKSGIISGVKV
jgi:signal-transduction protein with cAMP-binding, CBS, and nucleotidyltransferase domain